MKLLYVIGVRLYSFSIWLASLTKNKKAKLWIEGRKEYFDKLPDLKGKKVIWFHCASLGEFDQGLPLMKRLKSESSDNYILVTFFSPSGMLHYHKRNHCADYVAYLPVDTPSNAKKFIDKIKPQISIFVKYEFWINFINEAKQANSKIYNISGIFRENQRFFKWYGGIFRTSLSQFDWFFVQNEESKRLLASIGILKSSVTGDSRFDKVIENKESVEKNELIEAFKNNEPLLILGSTWPDDEAIIFPWIRNHQQKILIAPHDISEKRIVQIQKQLQGSVRYTTTNIREVQNAQVLILDTIGQLSNAYSYGDIAYVGGGFSGNLHNILEPAVFGLPVIFGPKHIKFPEANAFQEGEFGFSIKTTSAFDSTYKFIASNKEAISLKASDFVAKNTGASETIYQFITSN